MKWSLIFFSVIVLVVMEGVSWWMYREPEISVLPSTNTEPEKEEKKAIVEEAAFRSSTEEKNPEDAFLSQDDSEEIVYPRVTLEEKDGRVERTIHMGVRQYAWDPNELRVKEGELVRLVIHNADVMHGIAIPALGVNEDIPEEGAVVEFIAGKRGTFEFFCAVYCGVGHMEMQGRIIVE